MMWAAGAVAAMSSITFPAVSALVSQSADPDKQGDKDNPLQSSSYFSCPLFSVSVNQGNPGESLLSLSISRVSDLIVQLFH